MTESDNNASVPFLFCAFFFLLDEKQHLRSSGKKKKLIIHPSHPGWQFETRHYYVNLQNSHRQKIRFVHGRKKKKKEERDGKEAPPLAGGN